MAYEVEAKLKLTGIEAGVLLATLNAASSHLYTRLETNIYYDTPALKLGVRGQSLRIRSEKNLLTGDTVFTMTFKGKKKKAKFKVRDEHETQVSSLDEAVKIVENLGFIERFRFEKKRHSFSYGGCTVEIDELPLIGHYCEIEGSTPIQIEKVQELLGLLHKQSITKGYGQLVAAEAQACKIESKNITFASCKS